MNGPVNGRVYRKFLRDALIFKCGWQSPRGATAAEGRRPRERWGVIRRCRAGAPSIARPERGQSFNWPSNARRSSACARKTTRIHFGTVTQPITLRSMKWLLLFVAIVSEVIATSALKSSQGFTRLVPSILVVSGYGAAFYFLSLTLKSVPVAIAYSLWSGVGIVLVTIAGIVLYRQTLDRPAVIGIVFIVAGVVLLCGFSKAAVH
jgi:small multidrug resistance pump